MFEIPKDAVIKKGVNIDEIWIHKSKYKRTKYRFATR